MSLEKRVIVITGANSEIGKATAQLFAEELNKLVLIDKNNEDLTTVADICGGIHKDVLNIEADLTDDREIVKAIRKTIDECGKIDVLVNCEGITFTGNVFHVNLSDIYNRIMSLNMKSIMSVTYAVVPHLVATKGCVINVSSVTTDGYFGDILPYAISKAALTNFTKCIALELASKGVRVNAVHPGPTRTNVSSSLCSSEDTKEILEERSVQTAAKTLMEPEEVAELIVHLASDKTRSITGAKYVIDAGLSYI